jgi:pimeloyl-ACP methyl ester carboxylesterase
VQQIRFGGWRGAELAGVLHRAPNPKGGILLAHCFTCSKDLSINTRLANALADSGYRVLRFDFTGLGESQGAFEESTMVANVGDLVAASQWMIDNGLGPCAMVGHSLGGSASLLAASRVRTVRAVVTIGAPSRPSHIRGMIDDESQTEAAVEGCVFVRIAGRVFPVSSKLLEDLDRYDQERAVAGLNRPLLVLHSPEDEVVPVAEGERIFQEAAQPKAFEPLPGADHLLAKPEHSKVAGALIASFLDRML